MKKITLIIVIFLVLVSCKNKHTVVVNNDEVEKQELLRTYAEISTKHEGYWEGREYIDGVFKNKDSVHVPKEHTDHSWFVRYEGPGWENSRIGYRIYLDWRNAIDIFGKKVDSLVLPYVGQDGFDSYHKPAAWGQDVLKVGKSMGIGGYGRFIDDTVVHFQNVKNTFVKVENSEYSSSVNIYYENWTSGDQSIDLKSKLTIYSMDRFTQVELTPSSKISGLSTGIPINEKLTLIKKEGEKWAYIATYGKQALSSPKDNLGLVLFYKIDKVSKQETGVYDHLVIFKPTTKIITYYFLGAWEQELDGIKTKEDFLEDIDLKLKILDKKNKL